MKMNNLRYLIEGLGGIVAQNNPDMIPEEYLKMVACPFEAVEDAEAMEIEGCPSEKQCAACKRKWLKREAARRGEAGGCCHAAEGAGKK